MAVTAQEHLHALDAEKRREVERHESYIDYTLRQGSSIFMTKKKQHWIPLDYVSDETREELRKRYDAAGWDVEFQISKADASRGDKFDRTAIMLKPKA